MNGVEVLKYKKKREEEQKIEVGKSYALES